MSAYNGHNLNKATKAAEKVAQEANARLDVLRALQADLIAAVTDPDLVVCERTYGLPFIARVERVTKRDIVLEGGRRARRKTLKLEGGDSYSGTYIKHLDQKWTSDDA